MGGRLTTHVLNTAQGCPAANIQIQLWRIDAGGSQTLLKTVYTNLDGRTETPLLTESDLLTGSYELIFLVGEYFAAQGLASKELPFLDRVPVRFNIADPDAHYHIPLLASPWAYSTYRGS